MEERLQKIISRYGVASRRAAEAMIEAGRVRLNGNTARMGDTAIDGEDVIEIDGKPLRKPPQRVYLMLNKPRGYVTTLSDEKGRRTVAELVADCGQRVYPVGRLDQYSEGLLILTNDGELTNRMTHPKHEVEKVYHVWVSHWAPEAQAKLTQPLLLDGRKASPARVRILSCKNDVAMLEIVIHEGRNRQIRRLCEAAGITVTRLRRVKEGPLLLGDLAVGKWRFLTEDEVKSCAAFA